MEVGKEDEKITLWKGCDLLKKKALKLAQRAPPPKKECENLPPVQVPKITFHLKTKTNVRGSSEGLMLEFRG